jgi:hypothetical protein
MSIVGTVSACDLRRVAPAALNHMLEIASWEMIFGDLSDERGSALIGELLAAGARWTRDS